MIFFFSSFSNIKVYRRKLVVPKGLTSNQDHGIVQPNLGNNFLKFNIIGHVLEKGQPKHVANQNFYKTNFSEKHIEIHKN